MSYQYVIYIVVLSLFVNHSFIKRVGLDILKEFLKLVREGFYFIETFVCTRNSVLLLKKLPIIN